MLSSMNMKIISLIFNLFVLLHSIVYAISAQRGTWFWSDVNNQNGSESVVGDDTRENETIIIFRQFGISNVYGSYKNRPVSEPAIIKNWNKKLQLNNINSYLLLSDNNWIFTENHSSLFQKIQDRFIDFNTQAESEEKFVGIHFDVEPQGLDSWKTSDSSLKKDYLNKLLFMFSEVRRYLDTHNAQNTSIYADLPVWFDNIGGSIAWDSALERDEWYDSLSVKINGITLMAFERSTFSSVENGVKWEVSNFKSPVRLGLNANIESNSTWIDLNVLLNMADQLEHKYGENVGIDIQSFSLFAGNLVDNDQDSLPDYWENLNFGNLGRDGSLDYNHDGSIDVAEFLAGTDPKNSSSVLSIIDNTSSGEGITINWNAVKGKRYRIQYIDDISKGDWQNLSGDIDALDSVGTEIDSSIDTALVKKRFYRAILIH